MEEMQGVKGLTWNKGTHDRLGGQAADMEIERGKTISSPSFLIPLFFFGKEKRVSDTACVFCYFCTSFFTSSVPRSRSLHN